jgi:hypothetical protein
MPRLLARTSPLLSLGWRSLAIALLGALAGMSALSYLIVFEKYRFAIAVTVSLLLIAFSVVNIRIAIVGTLTYLVFMGDIRRMLVPSVGWSGEDPLLLIGPVFAIIVFAYAWSSQSVKINTPLAGWILALMGIMMIQMINPRQGGLIVGVTGALFYLVPLLWYWIGRTYATPGYLHQVLFYVVVPLGGLATVFGLYQTFYGYLPYQDLWVEIAAGAGLLGSKGIEKPISFFVSPTEHDNFILSALVVLIAALIHRRQYGLLLFIIPMIGTIILGGSRGPVAKLLVTSAGLWAVVGTTTFTWIVRGSLALLIGVVGLSWSLSSIEIEGANERVTYRFERQQKGFGVGETKGGNSAFNHLNMIAQGIKQGVTTPLGFGLGATTKAAAKYGGSVSGSTEGDVSDLFRATGLVGGVVYLIILFLIIRSALHYWTQTRSLLALSLAGVLAVNFFLWLMGGQYAMSALIWFLIGSLDRLQNMPTGTEAENTVAPSETPETTAPASQPPRFSPRVTA